ncbi:MAG: LPS assembly protein LptD [Phycisphaerales bacterium]
MTRTLSTKLMLMVGPMMAAASAGQPTVAPPPRSTGGEGGGGFGGMRLATAAQTGTLSLSGNRVEAWREGVTERLYLRGDVRVQIGVHAFSAARALVWMERVGDSAAGGAGAGLYQVAVYFDRAGVIGGGAAVAQGGDRLLVTALIEGEPSLSADALRPEVPRARLGGGERDPFISEGEARLSALVAELSGEGPEGGPPGLVPGSGIVGTDGRGAIVPGMSQPFEPGSSLQNQLVRGLGEDERQTMLTEFGAAERLEPIFAKEGLITFAAGDITFVQGESAEAENTVIVTGGVVVEYTDVRRSRTLQISAERAVAFLGPGKLTDYRQFSRDSVRAIYLEGNVVATDGRSTLRGPRVVYDVTANLAVAVDAVFHTFDARRGLPLYVRAATLRQTAQNQIQARDVKLANSSFIEPHLSIGATAITVTQERQGEGAPDRFHVDGKDLTLRAGGSPFFYYPAFSGDLERFPLKDVRFENSSDSGFAVKTGFDLFGLLGFDPPAGVRADLLLDVYSRRGVGFGTEGGYSVGNTRGSFLAYVLPSDGGRDTLTSGTKRDAGGDARGIIIADHRWFIDEKWAVLVEGSYISDENFVDAFYEPLAETRREFANAANLRRIDGNTFFSLLAKGSVNDFTPNEYLQQSQGYTVDKLPEASYVRVHDDILAGLAPGLLTYSSEFRVSNMALNFTEKSPAELGFTTDRLSQDAFGLPPGTNIGEALRTAGFSEGQVLRFDTRHEISMPLRVGAVNITPFGVARLTAYDTEFDRFNGGGGEQYRIWSAAGARAATTVQKVDDDVESRFFDLHRVRHIIEPSVTGWVAGTSVEQDRLPVYDESVESLADGAVFKGGINQVFQTQRGGEGRWRTVDFLRLNTEVVYASDDAPRESPIMRFFDYRPEFSQLGEFATVDAAWQVTDAVALTAGTVHDLDLNQPARTTTGLLVQHAPDFSTFIESHYINARDATFVSAGADYRLTDKYTLGIVATYDVDVQDFQELSARVNREFPSFVLALKLRYNNITDEVGFGFVLQPLLRDARRQRLQRLGRDRLDAGETFQGDPAPLGDPSESSNP